MQNLEVSRGRCSWTRSVLPLLASVLTTAIGCESVSSSANYVCSTCSIERHLLATISDDDYSGGAFGPYAEAHANQDGTYFVYAGVGRTELYRADTQTILSRVGVEGDGPGEYREPAYVMESASYYSVIDPRLQRRTDLDKRTLAVAATYPVPVRPLSQPVAVSDSVYVIAGVLDPADPEAGLIHIVHRQGSVLRTLDNSTGEQRSLSGFFDERLIALGRDRSIWVAHSRSYKLEQWDLQGRLLKQISRAVNWFPPPDTAAIIRRVPQFGVPFIKAIQQDDAGRLWVSITRARRGPGAPVAFRLDESHSDVIMEVLDEEGVPLVGAMITGTVGTPTTGLLRHSSFVELEDGTPQLRIWGYRLREDSISP